MSMVCLLIVFGFACFLVECVLFLLFCFLLVCVLFMLFFCWQFLLGYGFLLPVLASLLAEHGFTLMLVGLMEQTKRA